MKPRKMKVLHNAHWVLHVYTIVPETQCSKYTLKVKVPLTLVRHRKILHAGVVSNTPLCLVLHYPLDCALVQ